MEATLSACLWAQVLAVALQRRPIFPGGLMPVNIVGEKLVQELMQLKKAGCAAGLSTA